MIFDCRETHDRLDGWIDGQLDEQTARQLETHFSQCAACRQEADGRRREHEQLLVAFAPRRNAARRLAEAVTAELPKGGQQRGQQHDAAVAPRQSRTIWPWMQLLLAAAAGFLAAVLVFRPWERPPAVVEAPRGRPIEVTKAHLARLAVATGPVEYSPSGGSAFFACSTQTALGDGARVRTTQNARCELDLEESARLRLNEATQMRFAGSRRIELSRGRLWFDVAHAAEPYEIDAGAFEINASDATLDCSAAPPDAAVLVLKGSATVKGAGWEEVVAAGERLEVAGGRRTKGHPLLDPIVETRWVHDILIQKGPQDEELNQRINRLWAQVGRAKMTNLYEEEIRSLGGRCAMPLAYYIQSPDSLNEPAKRAAAARILADVAQPESIPQLIALLSDSSGEIRSCAAQALERLTGQNFGRKADAWQADSWGACQPTTAQWKTWWQTAKERYPGVKR